MVYASTSEDIRPDLPPDLIQDLQRIPSPFQSFESLWPAGT